MRHSFSAILLAFAVAPARSAPLEHSRARPAVVVVEANAPAPVATAAEEVAHYLFAITGVRPTVRAEGAAAPSPSRIYVGATRAAGAIGLKADTLGPEEWVVRSSDRDLFVIGGRPRGTLYAAYHLLEDVLGVHWWTPWDETVPKRPIVRFGALRLRGKPAFRYRDIYMLYGGDEGRFAARNRLNRDGDAAIHRRYGGSMGYGPPYHVHTAYSYFPPKEHFAQHPEWYSLIDGRRTTENAQLCWTNAELRAAFRTKLVETIRKSWADARASGDEPLLVFSISQNDCYGACQCGPCHALAQAEGSEAAPLLEFVNLMADAAREAQPGVFIDTLAYQYTQTAPRTIRPRDNVIIRLCDTEADMLRPITAPRNKAFRDHIASWARISKNLRIWDYAVTYGTLGMPLPTAHTYGPDLRFYLANRVEGVFTELEYEVLADLRDLKIWTLMKTLEDPSADYDRLTDTFMSGYYGPAGPWVKRYLRALEAEAVARDSRSTCWQGAPVGLSYLTPDFIVRAQALFDRAAASVFRRPDLAGRVAHARLPLDRATLMLWARLGPSAERLDRAAVGRRAIETWRREIDRRFPAPQRASQRMSAEGEIQRLTLAPARTGLPERFRSLPKGTVIDYTAVMTRNWQNIVKVAADPEAETGITNRLDLTAPDVEHPERYTLPMPWGVYVVDQKQTLDARPIQAADITGPGYHWYKLGAYTIKPTAYVWLFWSWIIHVDVDNAIDPRAPDAKHEVWARVKFEGPRFPHARAGEKDAICVERLILVRAQ